MNVYEALRGVEAHQTRTLAVPDREPVERIEWWSEEDEPIQVCGAFVSWRRSAYPGAWGAGRTRGEAEAACRAEAAERWILHSLGRHSDGSGVWTDEEGAVRAAQRETAERVATADWWCRHRSMRPLDVASVEPWGLLRLYRVPCRYAGWFVAMAVGTDECGLRPHFAAAGGGSIEEASEKAQIELATIRKWNERYPNGLWEYGCRESAGWLYAPDTSEPVEGEEPMPGIAVKSGFRGLRFAAVEFPREWTNATLRAEKRFP